MKATMKELHLQFLRIKGKTVGVEIFPKNLKAKLELKFNKLDGVARFTHRTMQIFDSQKSLYNYVSNVEIIVIPPNKDLVITDCTFK